MQRAVVALESFVAKTPIDPTTRDGRGEDNRKEMSEEEKE